jgi:hypothetical protein
MKILPNPETEPFRTPEIHRFTYVDDFNEEILFLGNNRRRARLSPA